MAVPDPLPLEPNHRPSPSLPSLLRVAGVRRTGPSSAVQAVVCTRDDFACAVCGSSADGAWPPHALHHRLPRGMGGQIGTEVNSPANLLLLCHQDHQHIESNRDQAYFEGRLVHRWGDPATTPVLLRGAWWLLGHDGTQTLCEETA